MSAYEIAGQVAAGERWPLKFGVFLAPFHKAGRNPTLMLEQDLRLLEHLDGLGYDEAWVGEHHSGGWEIVASPELFIASAAARTKHLRLGTGVVSLPYHHPLHVADRMVLLDHLTRGRVMLGVGPGQLASDAHMLGIDTARQREMMEESLEAIDALLAGREPVTRKTDWFTLQDAQLQLRPFQDPSFEIAVAATFSPGRAADRGPVRGGSAVDRGEPGGRFRRAGVALGCRERGGGASTASRWTGASGG
ncbi:LLM class flavin-dependent oxidoreductase [Yinghuangia aomiensis]